MSDCEGRSTEDLQQEAAKRTIEDSKRKHVSDAFDAVGRLLQLGLLVFILVFVVGPCVKVCAGS